MRIRSKTASLEDEVYLQLREMILAGELVSGEKLVQEDLSERLGVSRTPLRSAIAKLEGEDFVRMSSRSEAYVAEFGTRQIVDLFEVRAVLEGLICRLLAPTIEQKHILYLRSVITAAQPAVETGDTQAYRDADVEFHTYLTKLVTQGNLIKMLDSVHAIMSMSLSQGILRSPAETHPEHLAIIDALEAKNPDQAERLMIQHIRKTIELLRLRIADEEAN
ncbi:GntR family transcriptional regulator [Roseibium porphyridii]|uniref:GntR family transcriptional regulator n=1 Tax=Roseibium porphyridii TaxID=2866279 RepID=A0ABY8FB72_9HYPH|nr:GntR family transcriptional regulator [Roseibium sp. KMA01]WFE89868.1 GntR family transcriptional regulator [Roseibium sp. KMA01]